MAEGIHDLSSLHLVSRHLHLVSKGFEENELGILTKVTAVCTEYDYPDVAWESWLDFSKHYPLRTQSGARTLVLEIPPYDESFFDLLYPFMLSEYLQRVGRLPRTVHHRFHCLVDFFGYCKCKYISDLLQYLQSDILTESVVYPPDHTFGKFSHIDDLIEVATIEFDDIDYWPEHREFVFEQMSEEMFRLQELEGTGSFQLPKVLPPVTVPKKNALAMVRANRYQ